MSKRQIQLIIPDEAIINKIYFIRGRKIMLDSDLAEMYGVETKQIKRQIRRNINKFPEHFMFELSHLEYDSLRSHFGTLKRGGHAKYLPYAFTEHGVLQLANVLSSKRATEMSIRIIEVFVKITQMIFNNKDIMLKLEQIEKKLMRQDSKIKNHEKYIRSLFDSIKQLLMPASKPRNQISYRVNVDNKQMLKK